MGEMIAICLLYQDGENNYADMSNATMDNVTNLVYFHVPVDVNNSAYMSCMKPDEPGLLFAVCITTIAHVWFIVLLYENVQLVIQNILNHLQWKKLIYAHNYIVVFTEKKLEVSYLKKHRQDRH